MTSQAMHLEKIEFNFEIKPKGDETEHVSSVSVLSGIPFQMKVSERTDGPEKVIEVALICSQPQNADDLEWSCEAMATISVRLLAPSRELNLERIPKTKFSKECLSSEPLEIIRATDLSQYKHKGGIVFVVQLFVNPAFYQNSSELDHMRTTFRFNIHNIGHFGARKYSPDVQVQGAIWSVYAEKQNDHLGIFLISKRNIMNVNWSWHVNYSFTLHSHKDLQPITAKSAGRYFVADDCWGFRNFVKWDVLMNPDNGYIQNEKAAFEISLEVEPPQPLWNFEQKTLKTNSLECSICLQGIMNRSPASTKCGHLFCTECIKRSIQQYSKCPNCNARAELADIRAIFI